MTRVATLAVSLTLLTSGVAYAQPGRTPSEIRADVAREVSNDSAALRRQEHCDDVGAAACAEEDRAEAAARAAADRAFVRRCHERGWARCIREELSPDDWLLAISATVLILMLLRVTQRPPSMGWPARVPEEVPAAPPEKSDVAVLDVMLPRANAAALRKEIDRVLATSSPATALPQIAHAIAAARDRWSGLSVLGWPMQTTDDAWMRWRGLRQEVRARPSIEVAPPEPRIGDGYRDGPAPLPAHETEAHAVLSMVVLSKRELRETPGEPTERALALLETLGSLRVDEIEGVELVWLPDDVREEHTLGDLQARIPRLVPIERG